MEKDNETSPILDAVFAQLRGKKPSDWSKAIDDLLNSDRMKNAKGNLEDLLNSERMKTAKENLDDVLKSDRVQAARASGMEVVDKQIRKVFGFQTRSEELNYLGMEELKVGRYMSALAYFKDALKKDHNNASAKENIEKTLLAIKDISMKTLESLDHEAAKTITEIAVLEDQVSSVREHLELIEELIVSKREYLQELTDKYNRIHETSSDSENQNGRTAKYY